MSAAPREKNAPQKQTTATAREDLAWLHEHDAALFQEYRGKWIAVWKQQVISVGDTAYEVSSQADRIASPNDYTLQYFDPHVDVIYGGA